MLRRSIPLLILAGLLLAFYLAPQLPPVRGWLLDRAEPLLADAGYRLDYRASRGNPWTGVTLLDADIEGPGLELSAQELEVGYFLLGLLNGQLPLSLRGAGLRGALTVADLPLGSEGSGGAVRPLLREVRLEDAQLGITDIPYTLPDFTVESLDAESVQDGIRLEALLRTAEGEAEVQGVLSLSPFAFEGEVLQADAGIARRWWAGIEGGTVSGTLQVQNGQVQAKASVEDGSLSFLNERVTGIRGTVAYRHPNIEAKLTGEALGGSVQASGGVAIAERRWFAEADGLIDLEQAALWLAHFGAPDLTSLPVSGNTEVSLSATGWTEATVNGALSSSETGAGRALGYSLTDLQTDFEVGSETGTRANATARLAGGLVSAEVRPLDEGWLRVSVRGEDLGLLPSARGELRFDARSGPGGLRGDGQLNLAGLLLDAPLSAKADLTLDEDGYQVYLSGEALGGLLEGAAVLAEGGLSGALRGSALRLPTLETPFDLSLRANGPIGALPIEAEVTGLEPARFAVGGVTARADLSGLVKARLEGGRLSVLEGQLGALTLGGQLDLGTRLGELAFELGPVALSGIVEGEASLTEGVLRLGPGSLAGSATLASSPLELPGLVLPPLDAEVQVALQDGLSLTLNDPQGLALEIVDERVQASFAGFPLTLALERAVLDGSASFSLGDPLGSLTSDLRAEGVRAELELRGPADDLALEFRAPILEADLTGRADLTERTLEFSGALGGYRLEGNGQFRDGDLSLSAVAEMGEDRFTLTLDGPLGTTSLSASGRLPLEPLAERFGLPLSGTLTGDLRKAGAGYIGGLELSGALLGQPLKLSLTGAEAGLSLAGEAEVYGQTVRLSGQALPELRLAAESDWGRLEVAGGRVTGEGLLPGFAALGFALPGQAWQLEGSLDEGWATLSLPDSGTRLEAERVGGAWRLGGPLRQVARQGEAELALEAEVSLASDDPAGEVAGALTLTTPEGSARVSVSGSLEALRLEGTLSAALASSLAELPITPSGELALTGTLELLGGFGYDAQVVWQVGEERLLIELAGGSEGLEATVNGPGLSASYASREGVDEAHLSADGFGLGPYLAAPALSGELTGNLSHTPTRWWAGDLTLELSQPIAGSLRLVGAGERLGLEAAAERSGLRLEALGTLLPRLDLALGGGYRDLLAISGGVTGRLSDPQAALTLTSAALERPALGLAAPAQSWALSGSLQDGLRLEGNGRVLILESGLLEGALELPFTIRGEPHRLALGVSGALAQPRLEGALEGPFLAGPLNLDGQTLTGDLSLDLAPWLPALAPAGATLAFRAEGDLLWTASLAAEAEVLDNPAGLALELSGEGTRYAGSGRLSLAGGSAPVTLEGDGADLRLGAEFAAFDLGALELPVALTGRAALSLTFDTSSSPALTFEVTASGEALAQPFSLTLRQTPETPLRLSATLAGTDLALARTAPERFDLRLSRQDGLELTGDLSLGDGPRLTASGAWREWPLEVSAQYQAGAGSWRLRLGEASWTGDLTSQSAGWAVTSRLESPEGGPLPFSGALELAAALEGGTATLESATASTHLGGEVLALNVAGRLWPEPRLMGTLRAGAYGDFRLELRGLAEGYRLEVAQPGLALAADLSPALRPLGLTLDADTVLPLGPGLALGADLDWSAAAGFGGSAALALETPGGLAASAEARGEGGLELSGEAAWRGVPLGNFTLGLSPDPLADPSLLGVLRPDVAVSDLLPGNWGESLTLEGELELSGDRLEPTLSGPLTLSGALSAAGAFTWAEGQGTLELAGAGLGVEGTLDSAGWTLGLGADELGLGAFLPQLAEPRLNAQVSGAGSWGERPQFRAEGLALASGSSRLTGAARLGESLSGRLGGVLELADLPIGPDLAGRISGHLSLGPTEAGGPLGLGGVLEAEGLGLAGADASLSGSLFVSGPLASPALTARLRGSGSASGALVAVVEPAEGRYLVSSTLQWSDFGSDLILERSPGELSAEGTVRYRDFALALRETVGERLSLVGQNGLEGWVLEADLAGAEALLSGPLSSLNERLAGQVRLSAAWRPALRVEGGLAEVSVAGVALGDLRLTQDGGSVSGWRLAGEALAATFDLGGAWRLERLELPLTNALTLRATGAGVGSEAALSATLSGEVQGEPVQLPLSASFQEGQLELRGAGELFGGGFALGASASPENGWSGALDVREADFAGLSLSLNGALGGAFGSPQLLADLSLSGRGVSSAGRLEVSAEGVGLEQTLTAPLLETPLTISGGLWPTLDLALTGEEGEQLLLRREAGTLWSEGALTLALGPLRLEAAATGGGGLELRVSVPAQPGLVLVGNVPLEPDLLGAGLTLRGAEDVSGSVRLSLEDGPSLGLDELAWRSESGLLTLSGALSTVPGLAGRLEGAWQGANGNLSALPWLAGLERLEVTAELSPAALTVAARGSESVLAAHYTFAEAALSLSAALIVDGRRADLTLGFSRERGPSGTLSLDDFPAFQSPAVGAAHLTGAVQITPEAASGTLSVRLGEGTLGAEGRLGLGLLPNALAPLGEDGQSLTLTSEGFDPSELPYVGDLLPYLQAPLSGRLTLDNETLSGELESEGLQIGDAALPLSLSLAGSLGDVRLSGLLSGSPFEVTRSERGLAGLFRFERFPVEKALEARFGPSGVDTLLTGALRFELPPGGNLGELYLRFASEQFRLERGGVVTEGVLSFELEDGGLSLQEALFEGAGVWRASGEASREALDLRLEAQEADFSPILALVPQFAGFEVGAFGTLELVTAGSLLAPSLRLQSPALELRLSGNSYRLEDASFTLQDGAFVTAAQLSALSPLSGTLILSGGGRITLAPERVFDAALRFSGDTALPVLGQLGGVAGEVTVSPGEPWRLELGGVLGQPFSVGGTLAPLDLRLLGARLDLRAPDYFLAASETDVNLRFYRDEEYHLEGELLAHQSRLALSRASDADETGGTAAGEAAAPAPRARNPVLGRIHFEGVRLFAPQQITFQENFGAAELQADLTLSGTPLSPALTGSAQSLRGSVRFAGRDFSLREAQAIFEPSRGIYPSISVVAATSFDKTEVEQDFEQAKRAQNPDGEAVNLEFLAPTGPTFEVILTVTGEVRAVSDGARLFTLDVSTALSSDAELQETGVAGSRSLTEPELLSLLTLGRLELSPELASQGGLATSLAQGAVDTAVDFLILSELQREIGEALGVDLFEIRTTTLGTLLTGQGLEEFGVSLRIGGYLSDEVFASYQIGSLGLDGNVALRNEFNVSYDLYPLEFTLLGSLDFFRTPGLTPTPQVALNLSYAFTPLIRLQAGVSVSSLNQGVSFGVNFRW